MGNPYFIDEPAAISFSGGRTSAYMLTRHLDAHQGHLPDYMKVLFCNTGKEMPQTLDFVHRCARELSVDIVWLELSKITTIKQEPRNKIEREYKIVNYETASRHGEPFNALLKGFDAIPNVVQRTCTVNLKIRAMRWYLESIGYESPWVQYIGIRGDEQRRAVKLHGKVAEGHEAYCPLWVDGVTAKDVGDFWEQMPWDLELPNNRGVTDWGNCDLCFLKSRFKLASIIRERPDLADWWIKAEKQKGQFFRPDQPSYAQMKEIARHQPDMFADAIDESIPCFCGD